MEQLIEIHLSRLLFLVPSMVDRRRLALLMDVKYTSSPQIVFR